MRFLLLATLLLAGLAHAESSKLDLSALHTTGIRPSVGGLALAPIRPNPSRGGKMRVDFVLPRPGDVSISLVDVRGRVALSLARGTFSEGPHAVMAPLERVAPGLYFVTLVSDAGKATRRVIVLGK